MRCISPHANYSIQVIEGDERIVVDARGYGHTEVLKKPVVAKFQKSGLLDHEQIAAFERFSFSGLAEGVNPLTTLSSFDTEAYVLRYSERERDAMQVQIENRLKELSEQFPSQFIIVPPIEAEKPWGSYDHDSVEDILKLQERLWADPEKIRLYEVQNKNRPEVVNAMLAKEDPEFVAPVAEKPAPKRRVSVAEGLTTEEAIVVDA